MQRIGLPPETRKFMPHVTLARLRGTSAREVAEYLTLRGGFTTSAFSVDRFVLFSSRNQTGGGPYLVEDAYPLAPAEGE
jgi:2'-5' RNA ligase